MQSMEQEFYNQGLARIRKGDLKGAIQEFDQALQINPQFAEAYYRRGGVRFDLGDRQGAIIDYTQALQLKPDSAEAYFGRGLTRLALGELEGALEDANQALHYAPNHAAACNLRGTAYQRLGKVPEAIASLKQAAQLYLEQKDVTNCQRCLDRIKQLQTTSVRPVPLIQIAEFFQQAVQKFHQGDYRRALEDFNWLIQVDARDARSYCYRGLIRARVGNLQGAMQDLGTAMQLSPDDPQVRSIRGLVRLEMGDGRGALADFNQLLQDDPQNLEALLNRAEVHGRMGNHRQAIEDYSRGLQSRPESPELYCLRAAARTEFEDFRGALDDYQKAANLYFDRQDWPHYRQVLDRLKQLQSRPQLRSFPGDREVAVRPPTDLEVTRPFDQQSLFFQPNRELHERLLRMVGGNLDIAERLIDLAKQKYPDRPEEWYWAKVIEDLERDR